MLPPIHLFHIRIGRLSNRGHHDRLQNFVKDETAPSIVVRTSSA